jgi:hypothetical protein
MITPIIPIRLNSLQNTGKQSFSQTPAISLHSLKKDVVSFSGASGLFLDSAACKNKNVYEKELLSLFTSDKPFVENFKYLTNCLFRDFQFELGDIKELKYANIKNKPPLLFTRTVFNQEGPVTQLFFNVDKIKSYRENAINPRVTFSPYCAQIAEEVLKGNDLNSIHNTVKEIEKKLNASDNINYSDTKQIISDTLKKRGLNADYDITERSTEIRDGVPHSTTTSFNTATGNIYPNLLINFKDSRKGLIRGITHEFTHALNLNSRVFNNAPKLFECEKAFQNLGNEFCQMYEKNPDFFQRETLFRKNKYDELLATIFKTNPAIDKKTLVEALLNKAKNEDFAYSSSLPLEANKLPINLIYKDFHKYLLSILYDNSKMEKFN